MVRSVASRRLLALLIVLGLAALVSAAAWMVSARSVAPPPAAPAEFKSYPRVAFLAEDGSWIDAVAADMCWSVTSRSVEADTGYTNPGVSPNTSPFTTRVHQVVAGRSEIVLVQGGLDDYRASEVQLFDAATKVFTLLRTQLPDQTMIVAIGPSAPPGVAPQDVVRISGPIAAAAANSGVHFIDPAAEGWPPGPEEFANSLAADLRLLNAPAAC